MTTIRLRSNYDPTTTYRARLLPIRRKWKCQYFTVVVSRIAVESNTYVISITFVAVECVVVSSYHSCIVVESQLWYSLKTNHHLNWIRMKHNDNLPSSTRVHPLVSGAGTDCVRLGWLALHSAEEAFVDVVGGCISGLVLAAGDSATVVLPPSFCFWNTQYITLITIMQARMHASTSECKWVSE